MPPPNPIHARSGARHVPVIAKRHAMIGPPAAPSRETRPAPGFQQARVGVCLPVVE
ncbi:MAG: hypothetical protein M0Q91_10835 [Methanoregula sp.]|nr:hypothetical protein [Methanoregula sp.]